MIVVALSHDHDRFSMAIYGTQWFPVKAPNMADLITFFFFKEQSGFLSH